MKKIYIAILLAISASVSAQSYKYTGCFGQISGEEFTDARPISLYISKDSSNITYSRTENGIRTNEQYKVCRYIKRSNTFIVKDSKGNLPTLVIESREAQLIYNKENYFIFR